MKILSLFVLLVLALSGCGSGNGAARMADDPNGNGGPRQDPVPDLASLLTFAGNEPRASSGASGSFVTQSTNAAGGVTTDQIQITPTISGNTISAVSVTNAGTNTWTMDLSHRVEEDGTPIPNQPFTIEVQDIEGMQLSGGQATLRDGERTATVVVAQMEEMNWDRG